MHFSCPQSGTRSFVLEGQGELIAAQQRRLEAQVLAWQGEENRRNESREKWNRQRDAKGTYKLQNNNPEFLEKCGNLMWFDMNGLNMAVKEQQMQMLEERVAQQDDELAHMERCAVIPWAHRIQCYWLCAAKRTSSFKSSNFNSSNRSGVWKGIPCIKGAWCMFRHV